MRPARRVIRSYATIPEGPERSSRKAHVRADPALGREGRGEGVGELPRSSRPLKSFAVTLLARQRDKRVLNP